MGNHHRATTPSTVESTTWDTILPMHGIYPQWAAFVKTISEPHGNKHSHFATMQEAARKDVERAFGVLQTRWGIVWSATIMWESETLWQLMTCCVILHNMIVEDEDDGVASPNP